MAGLIRQRKISSEELVVAHLKQIETVNSALNAAVEIFSEEALEAARRADEKIRIREELGLLHGVPFSVKDSMDVAGHRTTAGTLGRRSNSLATSDAVLVARLKAAGAIPICKTNLPDLLFAYESDNLIFGRSNNPYDLERTPGGSSGGEAALIAACGSPLGLGSDAAGSVRVPAAFCGITSIKPTSGCLPRRGHVPGAGGWIEALWQIGPMARQVEDLSLAMDLLSGADGRDFSCHPVSCESAKARGALRVAFFKNNGFATCSSAVCEAVELAANTLRMAGMVVEEAMPPGIEQAFQLEMDLLGADGGDGIDAYLRDTGSDQQHWLLHAGFLDRMRTRRCSMTQFAELWTRWDHYRSAIAEFFQRFDAILCPVYTDAAVRHGETVLPTKFEGFSYTMAWNVSGNPAAVVCCGEVSGLPLNVQVVTPLWHEARALDVCSVLEDRLGGWRPPALAGL